MYAISPAKRGFHYWEKLMIYRVKAWMVGLLACLMILPPAAALQLSHSLVLSAGRSKAQNACASPWLTAGFQPGASCSENHTSYRLAYDYSITPIWGFEISYGDLGDAEGSGGNYLTGEAATWSMKSIGWAFAGTGTFPLGRGFSLLGKIGGVRAEFREKYHTTMGGVGYHGIALNGVGIISEAKNGLTYGLGLQYDLDQTFAFRAQYENFGKYAVYNEYGLSAPPEISFSMFSAGLVLKF
jgi:OmpA-OmpF porin, OOP family